MHENTRRGLIGVSERPIEGSAGLLGKIGSLRKRMISCLRWASAQADRPQIQLATPESSSIALLHPPSQQI